MNKRDLKAYIRYDGSGRVIPGSLILNRFKPKVGNWSETPAYECCNYNISCVNFNIDGNYLGVGVEIVNDSGDPVIMTVTWGDGSITVISTSAGDYNYIERNYSSSTTYSGTICFDDPSRVFLFELYT